MSLQDKREYVLKVNCFGLLNVPSVTLRSINKDLKMREQRRHRDYFISFTLSNVRELSWSWIPTESLIQVKKDEENFVVACLHPL